MAVSTELKIITIYQTSNLIISTSAYQWSWGKWTEADVNSLCWSRRPPPSWPHSHPLHPLCWQEVAQGASGGTTVARCHPPSGTHRYAAHRGDLPTSGCSDRRELASVWMLGQRCVLEEWSDDSFHLIRFIGLIRFTTNVVTIITFTLDLQMM